MAAISSFNHRLQQLSLQAASMRFGLGFGSRWSAIGHGQFSQPYQVTDRKSLWVLFQTFSGLRSLWKPLYKGRRAGRKVRERLYRNTQGIKVISNSPRHEFPRSNLHSFTGQRLAERSANLQNLRNIAKVSMPVIPSSKALKFANVNPRSARN